MTAHKWTEEERDLLKEHYAQKPIEWFCQKLGLRERQITSQAYHLGLKKPRPKSYAKTRRYYYTDKRDAQAKEQRKQIIARQMGLCQTGCGNPTSGKYCEECARSQFKRDMSSPRATEVFSGRF